MTKTKTNWTALSKLSGYNVHPVTLDDGTPDGTVQWNYQRESQCWIVSRHDEDGSQIGEASYAATTRRDLPGVLGEMALTTLDDMDPYRNLIS